MKILQVADWAALALGAFNAMCMAVVCLAIWINRHRAADLGAGLEPLVTMTAALAGLAVVAGGAVTALRKHSAWHWPLQLLLLVFAVLILLLARELG